MPQTGPKDCAGWTIETYQAELRIAVELLMTLRGQDEVDVMSESEHDMYRTLLTGLDDRLDIRFLPETETTE